MAINPNGLATLDIVGGENFIDPIHYAVEFKKSALENIFIQMRTRNGIIVQDQTGESKGAGVLVITRVKRIIAKGRTMGDINHVGTSGNNGLMNKNTDEQGATQQYFLKLLHKYDQPVFTPRSAGQLVAVDIINQIAQNIAGAVQESIDASTLATMISGSLKYNAGLTTANSYLVKLPATATTQMYLDAIISAQELLMAGDMTHGIGQFTLTGILAKPKFGLRLLTSNGVIVGGSNYAQEMIARGAIDPQTAYANYGTGTMGLIFNTPVILAPDLLWVNTAQWLGLTTELAKIQALAVDYNATMRGISDEFFTIVQSTERNKLNFLPDYRWGVDVLYGSGIVPIVDNDFTNFYNATTKPLDVVGPDVVS